MDITKRKFLYAFVLPVLVLSVFLSAFTSRANAMAVISWGVTPNSAERIPEAPAGGAEMLKKNNGLYVADTTEKKIYFTFDLGYEAGYTAEVLDILKENEIKAIFFLCGNYLKERGLIERMIAEGHLIGNHTDRHRDLPALSEEAAKKDITDFGVKFKEQYGGIELNYFRPPQGRFDERTLKLASAEGLKTLLWSIAIVDWGKKEIDPAASAQKVLKRVHPGAVFLSHITNAGTPKMLKLLIPALAEKGYTAGCPCEL